MLLLCGFQPPAVQDVTNAGQLDGDLGVLVLAGVVLYAPAALIAGVAQHGHALDQGAFGDLPGEVSVHRPDCEEHGISNVRQLRHFVLNIYSILEQLYVIVTLIIFLDFTYPW